MSKFMYTATIFVLFINISLGQTKNAKPFILGVTEEFYSKQLEENRILNIYLPEGYTQNDTVHYPVVYLLDGSADEDFIHVAGLVQFNTFSWVDRIPLSIVVGIATVDRRRDFTYPTTIAADKIRYPTTGHSDRFISFLEKDLHPFIEANYRATSSRTIVGQSLGGLLATEILLKRPELFDKYLIVSPSLWWDDGSLLRESSDILLESFSRTIDVYIGVGKEGLGPGEIPHVMEIDANLLADKLQRTLSKRVNIYFDYLPEEDHATIGHHAFSNGFLWLFSKDPRE